MGLETARTAQQLAEEQRVEAAQDGGQRLLLQKRHVTARGCACGGQQRPLHPLCAYIPFFFPFCICIARFQLVSQVRTG